MSCFCLGLFLIPVSSFLYILYLVFLRFVCKSCICISACFSLLVFLVFFCDSSPLYYTTLMCFSFGFLHVLCTSDFPAFTLFRVLADSDFGSSLYLTFCYSNPCLYFDSDLCLPLINLNFFHFHSCVHLGPSPSPSLHFRNNTTLYLLKNV